MIMVAGNYLRVRGEYLGPFDAEVGEKELPPRTRRIRLWDPTFPGEPGTTSAYAENT